MAVKGDLKLLGTVILTLDMILITNPASMLFAMELEASLNICGFLVVMPIFLCLSLLLDLITQMRQELHRG